MDHSTIIISRFLTPVVKFEWFDWRAGVKITKPNKISINWHLRIKLISTITLRRSRSRIVIGEGHLGDLILVLLWASCPLHLSLIRACPPVRNTYCKVVHLEKAKMNKVYSYTSIKRHYPQHRRCIPLRSFSSLVNQSPVSDNHIRRHPHLYSNMSCTSMSRHTQAPNRNRIPTHASLYQQWQQWAL